MNVRTLKSMINDLPDDMEVIIQQQHEDWPTFSPLSMLGSDFVYLPENEDDGRIYCIGGYNHTTKTQEELEKMPRCLVLFSYNY